MQLPTSAPLRSPGRCQCECRFQHSPHLKPALCMKSWCGKGGLSKAYFPYQHFCHKTPSYSTFLAFIPTIPAACNASELPVAHLAPLQIRISPQDGDTGGQQARGNALPTPGCIQHSAAHPRPTWVLSHPNFRAPWVTSTKTPGHLATVSRLYSQPPGALVMTQRSQFRKRRGQLAHFSPGTQAGFGFLQS